MTELSGQYNPYAVDTTMEVVHDETRDMQGVELMETLTEIRNRVDAQISALIEG